MSRFRRVLFPLDFSMGCQALVPTVRRMIECWDAEVTLLHVMETRHWLGRKQEFGRLMAQMRTIAGNGLSAPQVHCRLERGTAGDRILGYVRAHDIDLVVIPAGRSLTLYGVPIGGVADQVLAEAPCAVWLDWGSARCHATAGMYARRVCCALAWTDSDEYVLSEAAHLTEELDAQLTVVHPVTPAPGKTLMLLWDRDARDRKLGQARGRMETLRRRIWPPAEIVVEAGVSQTVVSRTLQSQEAGLLVTSNWREAILAAESECPVLRVAPPALATAAASSERHYAALGQSA